MPSLTKRCSCLFVLAVWLGLSGYARAAVSARALSGDEIAMPDGRTVRLAGIMAVDGAAAFLQSAVAGHDLVLKDAAPDRYGRLSALVFIQGDRQSLQDDLLARGLAFVYPAAGAEPEPDAMLAEERAARKMKTGYWRNHPDTKATDAAKLYGKYGFITGTIVKAERVRNKAYLDFGADWHDDFTIAIPAHNLRAFKKAGEDILQWQGKKIRVRGWVTRNSGPMIVATDPHQIELLD
ncbi:MAG: thermonuclease family protein [Alphaproteobacteria bacterium]|nr:thermonuclease family protein [Alphaproteobacteria bacterium]